MDQTGEREADAPASEPVKNEPAKKEPPAWRGWLWLLFKILVSVGGLAYVFRKIVNRDGIDALYAAFGTMRWEWVGLAIVMQLTAIGFAVLRWQLMLRGQGIRAGFRYLFPSFMIGRFWGAFTPGGLGLDGWKLVDVATLTGKVSRATAVVGVEKILGQLGMGLTVMAASVWGLSMMGTSGVLLINAFFVAIVAVGLTLLSRPQLFLWLFRALPAQVQPRLQALADAVGAYRGRGAMLFRGALYSVGIHVFNSMIYVCAAQALGVDLSVGVIFFGSTIQIISTLVPISVNGVGLREATAVALYTQVGLAEAQAVLIPIVGFALAEMVVSAFGIVPLLARRYGYEPPDLVVEDADREERVLASFGEVDPASYPIVSRGLVLGLAGGALGGMLVGLAEGVAVLVNAGFRSTLYVVAYGAIAYAVAAALGAGTSGAVFAQVGRWLKREAVPEPNAFGQWTGLTVAALGTAIAAFRVRRDLFHEAMGFKSAAFLGIFLVCAALATVIYFGLLYGGRALVRSGAGSFLLRPWGAPAVVGAVAAMVAVASVAIGPLASLDAGPQGTPQADAPNVLLVVVDTMRADHLPAYGYENGSTPNLDRFAEDAIVYRQAFANASWTRPSFASILTGRYPSSHGVMGKNDALPDELPTMAEVLRSQGGYATTGFVTNFNVAHRYNFQQGFEEYTFLERDPILGADDTASMLLLMQTVRQGLAKIDAVLGRTAPGSEWQDAETVNRRVFTWLEEGRPDSGPFFLFTAYMDPHDPYFRHPYDGEAYARPAHLRPDPTEADALRELYDGEITYWDEHFGQLMDRLRADGLYDDMLIVVTSDHGEEFAEHGGFWHGTTLYDEQIHVPLLVKLPRNARAGTSVRHWVQSVDLLPSILELVGLETPEGVQGGDLEGGSERLFAEENHQGNDLTAVRELRDLREWKLIEANAGNPRGLDEYELYAVDDDPGEQDNLADRQRDDVRQMIATLDEARREAAEGAVETVELARSADDLRRQCSLGYADGEECCELGYLERETCEQQGYEWNTQ